MKLHTASETVSFVKELEEKSAQFYEDLAQRYSKDEDVFLSYAKENKKYLTQIQRAYYSVITDAIEGGYAFDLEADDHTLDTELSEEASYSDALDKAVEIEEKIIRFYTVAAEQSLSLMADVPRNFKMVARKRQKRVQQLRSGT
jgi:rubrerythrin